MSQVCNVSAKDQARADLAAMVAAYVENGGAIQHCRCGARAIKDSWRELLGE